VKRLTTIVIVVLIAVGASALAAPAQASISVTNDVEVGSWHKTTVSVELRATTSNITEFVDYIEYSIDGGTIHSRGAGAHDQIFSTYITILAPSSPSIADHRLWYRAVSKGFKVNYDTHSCQVLMDTLPPVSAAPSAGGVDLALWHNHSITVNLAASDTGCGMNRISHRIGSGSWVNTPGAAAAVTVSSVGSNRVDYYAVDNLGNIEAPYKMVYAKIDLSAPVTSVSGGSGVDLTQWHKAVTLTLSAADPLSGVANTFYSVDGGSWTTGLSVTLSTAGDHTVLYRSTDNAGNLEVAKSVHLKIETTAPVTTASSGGEDLSLWHNHALTLAFSASDEPGGSGMTGGLAKTEYQLDGGPWTSGLTLTVSTGGDHAVKYRSTDNAGNVEAEKSLHAKVDTSAPVTTASGADDAWHNAPVTLTFNANDPLSGVAKTEYKIDGGSWTTGSSVTVSSDGDHTVLYRSTDNAGNVEADKSVHVKIDTGAPVTTVDSGGEDLTLWHNHAVTLTFAATDPQGVAKTEYAVDGGAWTTGSSLTVSGDGDHTVLYRSTDNVGNVEADKSVHVKIDTTGPVTAARAASGKKGHAIKLACRVSDTLSPKARAVKLVVKNARGRTVKTLTVGNCSTGVWYSAKWTPKAMGTYRYTVYAKDLAGNSQVTAGSAKVKVR